MCDVIHEFMRITDGIAMSDVLGWIFAAIGAVIVYKAIDHIQTSIERHTMLKEIEETCSALYNSVIAKSCPSKNKKKLQPVMVRSVLHDDSEWMVQTIDGKLTNKRRIEDTQLYIQIRKGKGQNGFHNEWISSQALHEMMLLCRRIEKMYKDKIIKRIDLADLSKEIVPLGKSGRIQFLGAYYGKYDADCVGYLVLQTIVSCKKYNNEDSVRSFMEYYNEHPEIHCFFEKSIRIRPVLDYFAVNKFKKIVLEYTDIH